MLASPPSVSALCNSIAASEDWLTSSNHEVATIYYIVVAPIALITAILALVSFIHNRREQLFANAIQTYRKHLELAVQWPRLAEPEEFTIDREGEEYVRYEWFVGVLLRACEELLEKPQVVDTKFPQWRKTIEQSLRFHEKYFSENEWFQKEGRKIYSAALLKCIDQIVEEYRTHVARAPNRFQPHS